MLQSFGLGAEASYVRPLSPSRSRFTESELLRRCRRGDDDAWRELVLAHQDRVITVLYRMTGDYQQALDLAQEAFVQVFRKLSTFRGDSSLSTWITSVALNTGRSIWRKGSLPLTVLDDDTVCSAEGDPAERAASSETERRLQFAVTQLPADMRVCFVLREFQGLSYQEISRATDVPLGTVESRLFRARARLRNALCDLLEEGSYGV